MGCFKWITRHIVKWLREGPKVGKARDQGGLETDTHGKTEDKRYKRGWLRVNGCLDSMLVGVLCLLSTVYHINLLNPIYNYTLCGALCIWSSCV